MKNLISFILLLSLTFVNSQVICPDLDQECEEGQTCCLSAEGYSCCPLEDAVCCSDLQHCCPDEYLCVVQFNICVKCPDVSKRNFTIKFEPLQESIKSFHQSNVCPGGQEQCPDGQTCCHMSGDQEDCCPFPDAVCCPDRIHCCPEGYICNLSEGLCIAYHPKITFKMLARKHTQINIRQSNICPGKKKQCSDGETCCPMSLGQEGCCPFSDAVCCSDKLHCCPEGFTCDVSERLCILGHTKVNITPKKIAESWKNRKHSKFQKKQNYVQCPDGGYCNFGSTCCLISSDTYGCCPFLQAVCCSDKLHCCPGGMTCDSSGYCTNGPDVISWFQKKPAIKRPRNFL